MYFAIKKQLRFITISMMLISCSTNQHSSQPSNPNQNRSLSSSGFTLSSSLLKDQQPLPNALKCQRDGGSGKSPPLTWSTPPKGTQSFAVIMHHYPMGTRAGVNNPSQYWLLWNLPGDLRTLAEGNPQSIGTEGSDKDGKTTGYTPPCSPAGGGTHTYTITVYALNSPPNLGDQDRQDVNWETLTQAIADTTLGSAQISFTN